MPRPCRGVLARASAHLYNERRQPWFLSGERTVSSSFTDQPPPVAADSPPRQPLTPTVWLILIIAVIGFAYDTYALLVMPLIARPALS